MEFSCWEACSFRVKARSGMGGSGWEEEHSSENARWLGPLTLDRGGLKTWRHTSPVRANAREGAAGKRFVLGSVKVTSLIT
jgi:hypothetical protein